MQQLLSVIIPIFNVESYLEECLNSFVNQTNNSFNVVLIDDGSTDKSSAIALNFVKKYPNIFSYFYQKNTGLGGARNFGLEKVNSKFVFFFDSDDWTSNKTVDELLNFINLYGNSVDCIFFNPVIYDEATKNYQKWHDEDKIINIFNENLIIDLSDHPEILNTEASVCRAIWKTDLIKRCGFKFEERCCWEDVYPHFLLLHNSNKIAFLDYAGAYFYRTNTNKSITSQTGKSRLDIERVLNNFESIFPNKEWTKKEKLNIISFFINYLYWFIDVTDYTYRKTLTQIIHGFFKRIQTNLILTYLFSKSFPIKTRIKLLFVRSNLLYKKLFYPYKIERLKRCYNKIKRLIK